MNAWYYISVALLLVSALVHLAAFVGFDLLDALPWIWVMHLGILVACGAALLSLSNRHPEMQRGNKDAGRSTGYLLRHSPPWLIVCTVMLFLYALGNFVAMNDRLSEGSADRYEGKLVLRHKSTIVREISPDEFHALNRYQLRGFSGHWMLFSSIAATLFGALCNETATVAQPSNYT